MQAGFIGLGALGTIMVNNLVEKGHSIHIYNRTQEKMELFRGKAELHTSLSSIAETCDIILSIVSDDKALQAITLGKDG
jgi:3-hydroxyisobutyrate dehydrogenase